MPQVAVVGSDGQVGGRGTGGQWCRAKEGGVGEVRTAGREITVSSLPGMITALTLRLLSSGGLGNSVGRRTF